MKRSRPKIKEPQARALPLILPNTARIVAIANLEVRSAALEARVLELEGDLIRVVDLIIKGDIESAKFKEILTKRQGR